MNMTSMEMSSMNFGRYMIHYEDEYTQYHAEKSASTVGLCEEKYEQKNDNCINEAIFSKTSKQRNISS